MTNGKTLVFQIGKLIQYVVLAALLTLVFQTVSFGQATTSSQPGSGTRRNFALYGDLKIVDESPSDRPKIFDVILYTLGGDVFSRQRVGSGGRYRFNNIFNGDYYLAVELDSVEIARLQILIAPNAPDLTRQDLEFKYKASATVATKTTAFSADSYDRSPANKTLYEKASRELSAKNYPEATTTLKALVAADPKDYPAWAELGMVYFVQKDLESAESSYTSALSAKPDHLSSLINLGRVRLARKSFEGAVEVLENAVKVDPKSAQANYFLGEAYLQVKKGSKALGALNAALELDPVGMADAHLRLGSLYNSAGYKDRAAAEYEKFLAKKPDYPDRKKLEEYIQANKPKTETPKP